MENNKLLGKIEDEMIEQLKVAREQLNESRVWREHHEDEYAKHSLSFYQGLEYGLTTCIDIVRKYYKGLF